LAEIRTKGHQDEEADHRQAIRTAGNESGNHSLATDSPAMAP